MRRALELIQGTLRRRAQRAWRETDAPLILCYGNLNRSAFAAGVARRRGRAGAQSAGFYPEANRPSPEATVACAAEYGVDLRGHRSRRVTRADLAQARAVFVFDFENLRQVARVAPLALFRTHLVGSLDDDPHVLIADPHGRGQTVLADTLARIARALEHAEGSS